MLVLLQMLIAGAVAAEAPLPVLQVIPEGTSADVVDAPGELHVYLSGETPGLLLFSRTEDRREDRGAPTCDAAGVDLYAFELAPEPWVPALCTALSDHPPALPIGPRVPRGQPEDPPISRTATAQGVIVYPASLDADGRLREARWPWRPLHPLVLMTFVLATWVAPRRREPWFLALGALLLRVALTPERAVLQGDLPFERYVTATGLADSSWPRGDAWGAILGPFWLVFQQPEHLTHLASLVASALTVAFLWDLVSRWFDERAGRAAALLQAFLPLPIALSRTEDDLPLATLLQVIAALGVARGDRRGAVLSASAIALLSQLHAVHLAFAILPTVALLATPRFRLAGGVAALFIGMSAVEGARHLFADPALVESMHLAGLGRVVEDGYVVGPGGRLVASDPSVTPIAVTALTITSLLWTPAPFRGAMQALWCALILTTLPSLHLIDVSDSARLQLPAQTWIAALAGVAIACLDPRARNLWFVAIGLSWLFSREPMAGGVNTWTAEHSALREALRRVPDDAIVRFRPVVPESPWQQRYYQLQRRGVWIPHGLRPLAEGEYRWISRTDADVEPDPCSMIPVIERMVSVPRRLTVGPQEVLVGLFEVRRCDAPPPPPLEAPRPNEDQTPIPVDLPTAPLAAPSDVAPPGGAPEAARKAARPVEAAPPSDPADAEAGARPSEPKVEDEPLPPPTPEPAIQAVTPPPTDPPPPATGDRPDRGAGRQPKPPKPATTPKPKPTPTPTPR